MSLEKLQVLEAEMIYKAIEYANNYHKCRVCREKSRVFIMKSLEVMMVLNNVDADIDLIVAGALLEAYDESIESRDRLRDEFGEEIANLIFGYQGLREVAWNDRVMAECNRLAEATKREKILALADIVVKQRQLYLGYSRTIGDYWSKLDVPYEASAKYYSNVQDALYDLEFDENLRSLYWEMVNTYKDLFVKYYFDEKQFCLYQVSADGVKTFKTSDDMAWLKFDDDLPNDVICIPRDLAERVEDDWDNKREPVNYDCMN